MTIVRFQLCSFLSLSLSDPHTHRNAPDGCNWCSGMVAANNCNYQKWLVAWKQSRVSFYVWMRRSDVSGTLGNSTLQLIFNTLKLIVFSHAAVPTELFTRWCEMNFWVIFTAAALAEEGSAAPFDNDNAEHTQSIRIHITSRHAGGQQACMWRHLSTERRKRTHKTRSSCPWCPLKSSNIMKHLQSNYVCFSFLPLLLHFLCSPPPIPAVN